MLLTCRRCNNTSGTRLPPAQLSRVPRNVEPVYLGDVLGAELLVGWSRLIGHGVFSEQIQGNGAGVPTVGDQARPAER